MSEQTPQQFPKPWQEGPAYRLEHADEAAVQSFEKDLVRNGSLYRDCTSQARHAAADYAVQSHCSVMGGNADSTEDLIDILISLRLWAQRDGVDFDDAVERSKPKPQGLCG